MEGGLRTPNARPQPLKQMSSRLLNMKFMQRATASTSPNQRGGALQTPSTEPAFKRRKIHDASTPSSRSVSSTPGTTYAAENRSIQQSSMALPDILRRAGTSTFTRGEGADTEWVLDLKFPAVATPHKPHSKHIRSSNHGTNDGNVSAIPGLGEVDDDDDTSQDEEEDEDEDIWHNQPAGRQTYGSFKCKSMTGRTRTSTDGDAGEDDEDLSSASTSGSDSDSNPDSNSDSDSMSFSDDDDTSRQHRKKQKKKKHGRDKKHRASAAVAASAENSDEEMRRVRRAMEQKHDRMAGLGGKRGPGGGGINAGGRGMGGGGGNNAAGRKKRQRGPDEHHHHDRDQRGYGGNARRSKKPRKTI